MSVSAPVPQRLFDSVDESPVMAYVKDLDGRYLRVNQRYEEFFEVGGEEIRDRTDDELAPQRTIDGPRLASGGVSEDEPLQLEYTVAPFEGRPALAVWRFTVRAGTGETVAVCGVAAPVADAPLARRECERLMAVAHETEPGVAEAPVEPEPQTDDHTIAALHEASASAARRAHELLSELTEERERRAEAETRAADGDELRRRLEAAEAATVAERARADETGAVAKRERERVDAANVAVIAERARADEVAAELHTARGELASVRGRLEGLEATTQREVTRAEEAEAASERARKRVEESLAELNAARGELASVRGRLESAEAAAQAERTRAEEAEMVAQASRARAEELRLELDAAQLELASKHEQRTHSEQEQLDGLRHRLEEANEALKAEQSRAEEVAASLNSTRAEVEAARVELASERERRAETEADVLEARAELEAARVELASERERRTQTEEEVVGELRRQIEEADAAAQAERSRAEEAGSSLNQARAELEAARVELAAERERQTQTEAELVSDLRRRFEEADEALTKADAQVGQVRAELEASQAELALAHTELGAAPAGELVEELHHKLEHAEATARHNRDRADGAEAALNAERAEAEIRIGVAERRIAELEASLAEARAKELEADIERPAAGPTWDASAQRAFTTALSQSSDWRVSVKSALGVVGSQGGWDAVCAWQPDDLNGFASCFAMWTGENHRLGALETATWQRRQPLTGSTIGEALTSEDSAWLVADARAADRRLQLLAQHGIRGALIVPVKDGARPVAALELLTVGATEPSRELVDAIETIALQLGHFSALLSAGAQPRWRFGRT